MAVSALVASLVMLAACAAMPTSGPINSEPRRVTDPSNRSVLVEPEAPPVGASAAMIIRGFLTAMASKEPDFVTARQYLTSEAAEAWDPSGQVMVYASGTTPRVSQDQVTLAGSIVGYLNDDGSFVASSESNWRYVFELTKVDGELRISNPLPGRILSQYSFNQNYPRLNVYFFPTDGKELVPDPRYVSSGDPTEAARLVLAGPSPWLSGIVDHSWLAEVSLAGPVLLTVDGVADVPLDTKAANLSIVQASRLATELSASMRSIAGVDRIRLLVNGDYLPLTGALTDGSLPVVLADQYDVPDSRVPQDLVAVIDQHLVRLDPATPTDQFVVNTAWGSAPHPINSLAWRRSDGQVAAVTDQGMLIGTGADGVEPQSISDSAAMLRPDYDQRGNLWLFDQSSGSPSVSVLQGTRKIPVDASILNGMEITDFQLSLDGRRMLLSRLIDDPAGPAVEIGIALVAYSDSSPSAIIGWQPLRLAWQGATLSSVIDLAWIGPSSLAVLGAVDNGAPQVYASDLDGLSTEQWGMPGHWTPLEMAVNITSSDPQVVIRVEDGSLWSYDNGYQWKSFAAYVTAITFPK
jgi:hypothetical protein